MWKRKWPVLATLFAVFILVVSIAAAGCSQDTDTSVNEPQIPQDRANIEEGPPSDSQGGPGGGAPGEIMAEAAQILQIEVDTLQDAFAQARSQMPDGAPAGKWSDEFMTQVAQILQIQVDTLQDAFAQARGEL